MNFCLPNIINIMYIQHLTDVILPSIQSTVEICKQTAIFMFTLICRFVAILKFIYASKYFSYFCSYCLFENL
jgi:hypothetical protein